MPTYEYRCKACGEQLEVVQSFTDDPLTTHDACGGELRKVFGSVGIAFKGSGFYKNDSRGKSSSVTPPGSSDGGSSEKSSSDAGSSSSSSESSKPAGDAKAAAPAKAPSSPAS